jgi:helicase
MVSGSSRSMERDTLPLPDFFHSFYQKFADLTPIQCKSVDANVLRGESLLVCAPTASGKTLVATMAICSILGAGKALYVVPLKALAQEKYSEYQKLFENTDYTVGIAIGDMDKSAQHLAKYDLILVTSEKLDALLRHQVTWLAQVRTVVIDEIHLLNDTSRGPTLEIILTLLKILIQPQIIGLSATIGNPEELAKWLGGILVQDDWRPVQLKKGIHHSGETTFYE